MEGGSNIWPACPGSHSLRALSMMCFALPFSMAFGPLVLPSSPLICMSLMHFLMSSSGMASTSAMVSSAEIPASTVKALANGVANPEGPKRQPGSSPAPGPSHHTAELLAKEVPLLVEARAAEIPWLPLHPAGPAAPMPWKMLACLCPCLSLTSALGRARPSVVRLPRTVGKLRTLLPLRRQSLGPQPS